VNEAAKERGLDPKADMWRMPAMEVGAYGEKDAELTLKLWHKLKKIIVEDDLQDIFNLETDLFPCLVDMRFLGVRVDVSKANQLKTALAVKEEEPIATNKNRNRIRYSINGSQKYFKTF
jgi:DNA polymerase I-like protein with 3'-5' exonuclease and polymerase domains